MKTFSIFLAAAAFVAVAAANSQYAKYSVFAELSSTPTNLLSQMSLGVEGHN